MTWLEIDKYGRALPPEPFKIYVDHEGYKGRGWNYQDQKFYFNDIGALNQINALGQLAQMMFGRD